MPMPIVVATRIISGVYFVPTHAKLCGNGPIHFASVYRMVVARSMLIVPKVAMIGGICSSVINPAFTIPQAIPTSKPSSEDTAMLVPCIINVAVTAEEKASMEATDRSIPAVNMTAVIPAPITPNIAVSRATVKRFIGVANVGSAIRRANIPLTSRMSGGISLACVSLWECRANSELVMFDKTMVATSSAD